MWVRKKAFQTTLVKCSHPHNSLWCIPQLPRSANSNGTYFRPWALNNSTDTTQGEYPRPHRDGVVPASDGAGVVEAVGPKVSRFKSGDKVVVHFFQAYLAGYLDSVTHKTGLGATIDGSLQQYGVYDEQGLVRLPSNLNYLEGATLTCAGLTAWNALYGLTGRRLSPGDWILTQGTGGVSIFALQVGCSDTRRESCADGACS